MDYMVRLLIGAAQLVCRDKANQAADDYDAVPGSDTGAIVELLAQAAEKGRQKGRQEAWGEASVLIDRVCAQADRVPF